MSIESFFTVQNKSTPPTQGQGVGAPLGMPGEGAQLDFMAFFLQTLEHAAAQKDKADKPSALHSSNAALEEPEDIDFTGGLTDARREEIFAALDAEITKALNLNQEALDENGEASDKLKAEILNALLLEDKNAGKPKLHAAQDLLAQLQALVEAQDPALINANLTPAQMRNIQAEVDLILSGESTAKDSAERLAEEGIFAGIVVLIEPQNRTNTLFLPQSLGEGQNSRGLKPANDLAHQMGSLTSEQDIPDDLRFADFLRNLAQGSQGAGDEVSNLANLKPASGNNGAPAQDAGLVSLTAAADASALQGWPFSMSGSLLSSLSSFSSYDEMGLSGVSQGQVGNPGNLTALVTQAQSAAQAHPATQMVAATIQKAAASGDTTNITLHLNPPDLGRVEVRMALGTEKSMKTTITVEKPETLMLLQRDVAQLERALQGSGLDLDSGIDFELAGEDFAFGQDGSHDGHRHGQNGNGQESEDEELELWETTMTWSVDPETGHTKYDLWA